MMVRGRRDSEARAGHPWRRKRVSPGAAFHRTLSVTCGQGASPSLTSLVSAIPFAAASIAMLLNAAHSRSKRERRYHIALPSLLGGCAMAAGPTLVGLGAPPLLGMGLLCVAAAGTWGVDGPL